jgi:glutamine synthetase
VAPSVNSYKRLVPGYEAPVYIGWAEVNRSALIRIPRVNHGNNNGVRIELRCPDPSANPYLAFNAMLAAGLDGIDQALSCPKPLNNINVYELNEAEREELGVEMLPGSLKEALDEFQKDTILQAAFGSTLTEKFIESRMAEWEAYRIHVSDWEVSRYLETL